MALFSKKSVKNEKTEIQAANVEALPKEFALSLPFALVQPRISEKAGGLAKLNKYVFMIKRRANKAEVKKAVESKYKVRVMRVNIINTQGKIKRFGQTIGRTSGHKKAIVTLRKGDIIKGLTDVA